MKVLTSIFLFSLLRHVKAFQFSLHVNTSVPCCHQTALLPGFIFTVWDLLLCFKVSILLCALTNTVGTVSQHRLTQLGLKCSFHSCRLKIRGAEWLRCVCRRGRYGILYLTNVKHPPTCAHGAGCSSTNVYLISKSFHCATNPNASLWLCCFGERGGPGAGQNSRSLIGLRAGTDWKDERKREVCLFQVNMPPGLPTHPK